MSSFPEHRTLPQNQDAERGILCSILLSPNTVLSELIEKATEEWFYSPKHQLIYRTMVELWQKAKPIDFIHLTNVLKENKDLDKAGGAGYISELFTFLPTALNADYYIDIVREKFLLRQLIQVCTELAGRAYEEQGEANLLLDEAEEKVMSIGTDRFQGTIFTSKECVADAVERYEAARKSGGAIQGLLTGIKRLDEVLRGLRGGQMIVVAAKQKHGKSALGWQIADFNAVHSKNPIAVGGISLEMSRQEITDRRIAQHGRTDLGVLDSGTFSSLDITKIVKSSGELSKSNVFIKDEAGVNILQIRATLRRMKQRHNIGLAIIDYLQIISPLNKKDSRERQVAEISVNIKQAAKELDIPIIVLCQINKNGDMRESTAIEMDCDKLILIENDEDQEDADWEKDPKPKMFLRVKYNRGGPSGRIPVLFHKKFTLFEGMEAEVF